MTTEVWMRQKLTVMKSRKTVHGCVAKLANAPDLGSGAARLAGSSPSIPTILTNDETTKRRNDETTKHKQQNKEKQNEQDQMVSEP